MTHDLDLAPRDEWEFLDQLRGDGLYVPAQTGFRLQDHVIVNYTAPGDGSRQSFYALIVGRRFQGRDREPTSVKIKALISQIPAIRERMDGL